MSFLTMDQYLEINQIVDKKIETLEKKQEPFFSEIEEIKKGLKELAWVSTVAKYAVPVGIVLSDILSRLFTEYLKAHLLH